MALSCQKNSYLKEFTSTVQSCEAASESIGGSKLAGYHIILEDTILFPEGGGQPDDRGTLNDVPVLKVFLKDSKAVHFTPTPIDVDTKVDIKVDWTRRFDHMQQHSAQHLITAVAENEYNFKTTSWWLGEGICKIELNTPTLTPDQIAHVENLTNDYIRQQRNMYPSYYDNADDPAVQKIKTRGLPDNLTGPIRVMIIEGVDENLCCGTHVSNLSHLQAVKLVGMEKGKKGSTLLLYHAGYRVLKALDKSLDIERRINTLMKGSPSDYPDLIKKLQNSFKVANKNASTLLKEIVGYEAQELSNSIQQTNGGYIFHHRKEGDNDYMNILLQKLTCPAEVIKFITVGDDKGAGSFVLSGPEADIKELGQRILEIIDGKGAAKKDKFMGRANKLSQKHKVEQLIKDHVANRS